MVTVPSHFAFGHGSLNKKIQKKLQNVEHERLCVRIIISWAGFTKSQIASVNEHNESNSNNPILLVCPTETTGERIYSREVYDLLKQKMEPYSLSKTTDKTSKFSMDVLSEAFCGIKI